MLPSPNELEQDLHPELSRVRDINIPIIYAFGNNLGD
jgi:hypothetical protein